MLNVKFLIIIIKNFKFGDINLCKLYYNNQMRKDLVLHHIIVFFFKIVTLF